MDYLISMYIDDEMDLDDKITFVEEVHRDEGFRDETIDLLQQEKILRGKVVDKLPQIKVKVKRQFTLTGWRPLALLGSALATAVIVFLFSFPVGKPALISHRFLIYRPDVTRAEITGTFTGWQNLPLRRVGDSGYWEINLDLPRGEHHFTYILEGNKRFADPTTIAREHDDFGGENSILFIES